MDNNNNLDPYDMCIEGSASGWDDIDFFYDPTKTKNQLDFLVALQAVMLKFLVKSVNVQIDEIAYKHKNEIFIF